MDNPTTNPVAIGLTGPCPLNLTYYTNKTHPVPFVSQDIQRRTNPKATLKQVQSIFVFGVSHALLAPHAGPQKETDANNIKGKIPPVLAPISTLGLLEDYHPVVRGVIQDFVKNLGYLPGFKYKICVDSGGLDERALAKRAGLGFYGRHGLLIHPVFGSRFHIGLLLTNLPMVQAQVYVVSAGATPAVPSLSACPPHCNQCINACPNGALTPGQPLAYGKCISYLTQKPHLTPAEENLLQGQVYGCDICQNACPFNKEVLPKEINIGPWQHMTPDALAHAYRHTAMGWQGGEILKRNAKLATSHKRGK